MAKHLTNQQVATLMTKKRPKSEAWVVLIGYLVLAFTLGFIVGFLLNG